MTVHLIWAAVLALSVLTNCATHARLESAQTTIKTYQRDLKDQKEEAAATLAAKVAEKEAVEKALAAFKAEQELKDAANKTMVKSLADRLLAAGNAAGRLRDPNATGCGPSGGGAKDATPTAAAGGPGNPAETGGLLSVQLSELLRQRLREADDINVAYAACRADTLNLRAAQTTTGAPL